MPIIEVIKYEGDNSTFIWKHPAEDFNTMSQLIVHESQEAILFLNGQALDSFGPGRYTLDTQNIPILKHVVNLATGGESPFHCEVYFINKAVQMAMKWGTDSKVRYLEPEYGLPLELGASGSLNLQVTDSRKLLIKLVGTMSGIAWDDETVGFTKSIQNSFRPLISMAVKSNLTSAIKASDINVLEVDEHLEELSAALKQKIEPGFEEYGLAIPQFFLTNVVLPEEDPNFRRIRELHTIALQVKMTNAEALVRTAKAQAEAGVIAAQRQTEMERQQTQTEITRREAERKMIGAQADLEIKRATGMAEADALRATGMAEAEVMRAKGYSEKDVLAADVQKAYAAGIGQMGGGGSAGGSAMSDIIGLGVGLKAAGLMGGQLGNLFGAGTGTGMDGLAGAQMGSAQSAATQSADTVTCPKCGNILPAGAKFCLECGTKIELLSSGEMICPKCGKKTPKGKFCMECGASLIVLCRNCGKEIPQGGKFCLECGTRVE